MQEALNNYYTQVLKNNTNYPRLEENSSADVCVIGGGLAGINTALGLAERGKNVIVLEANRLGWGASGRNAGFVAKGFAADEEKVIEKIGLEETKKLVELSKAARQLIKKRIAQYNIDCEPVIDGVLTVAWNDSSNKMKNYVERINGYFDLGFEFMPKDQVRELCKTEMYYDGYVSPNDFQFNPLEYLLGLSNAVCSLGGRIYEDSKAVKIEKRGAAWVVHCEQGKVEAQHIVLCGSSYMHGVNRKLENATIPVQTYMMTTAPIDEELLNKSLNTEYAIYDSRWCSDYYHRLPGNRILWGGRVSLFGNPENIAAAMLNDMFKVYPQLKGHVKADSAWSGKMCYAAHKMPQIGQMEPGYWYNTAYGGHGICPTTVGGEVVAQAIAEGRNEYELFAPFGVSFIGGKFGAYGTQLIYFWWKMRDSLGI